MHRQTQRLKNASTSANVLMSTFFSCGKSLRFLAHIFWNCAFFPRNVREKRKTQTKNYHCQGPLWPHHSDAGKHRIKSGYTVLNRRSPGSGPGGFIFFKQLGFTGTHRAAKQRRLFPGHHRSSSGLNRIFTVRPPGETVANQHELCPRWRYGDSRLGHGVSRRRVPA